jgi:hypothetical protein
MLPFKLCNFKFVTLGLRVVAVTLALSPSSGEKRVFSNSLGVHSFFKVAIFVFHDFEIIVIIVMHFPSFIFLSKPAVTDMITLLELTRFILGVPLSCD